MCHKLLSIILLDLTGTVLLKWALTWQERCFSKSKKVINFYPRISIYELNVIQIINMLPNACICFWLITIKIRSYFLKIYSKLWPTKMDNFLITATSCVFKITVCTEKLFEMFKRADPKFCLTWQERCYSKGLWLGRNDASQNLKKVINFNPRISSYEVNVIQIINMLPNVFVSD